MSAQAAIRTPDQRLRVFVSSTMNELAAERTAARDAISALRLSPVLFELGARPHPPRDLYRSYLEQSDVFIGIYGKQYGWVAPDMEISGIEDEYLLAAGKPMLIYVKQTPEKDPRLQAMLERITAEGSVSYKRFATDAELRELIADDLALMITEHFQAAEARRADETVERELCRLPSYPTRLIGRERLLTALERLVLRDDVRIVTLTGPGGTGKTRLAVEAAWRLCPHFDAGAHMVPLASVNDPGLVASTVAATLGVHETRSHSPLEALKAQLQSREMLLFLDNFEQIVEAGRVVSELLRGAPDLRIMVTSRQPLRVYGEHEFLVPPLDVPEHVLKLEALRDSPSVQLFVERARAVRPDFELDSSNAAALTEICARLDGLPLAIELAAARVRVLPPEAIVQRLTDRLDILSGGARDLPERQRTMRATIAWSYGLLDEHERRLFCRLGIFTGGFALSSAEAVCNPGGELPVDTLDALASLIAKNLVRTDEVVHGEPRFGMLELMRAFALEKLAEDGELDDMRQRHAGHFAELSVRYERSLVGAEGDQRLRDIDREYHNLLAALSWALERSSRAEPGAECLPDLLGALYFDWYLTGRLSEGREWCDRALAATERLPGTPPRAGALFALGSIAMWQGDLPLARRRLQESVDIWRRVGDSRWLGLSLLVLGVTSVHQGQTTFAKSTLTEAKQFFEQQGEESRRVIALMHLGDVAMQEDNSAEARAYLEHALDLQRAAGGAWSIASLLNNLGEVARYEGDHAEADRYYREALTTFEEGGAAGNVARCWHALGYVALRTGRLEQARELFARSVNAFRDFGSSRGIAECLQGLAGVAVASGDAPRAARLLGASSRMLSDIEASLWPADARERDRDLKALKQLLPDSEIEREMEAGASLSQEEAISLAGG